MLHWKNLFYFQKGERIAIITLLILILIAGGIYFYVKENVSKKNNLTDNKNTQIQFAELEDSIKVKTQIDKTIKIDKTKKTYSKYETITKLQKGETIKLNSADTTAFKKIPKIGSSFARRIVKYRELLGGYVSLSQLKEIWGMDDYLYEDIKPYIELDKKTTKKLRINHLTYKELIKHPYLDPDQVKVILDIRERKGDILSMEHLGLLDEFTENDIKRLSSYVSFD